MSMKLPCVLIDLPANVVTSRQMLMGIHRYAKLHGPWFTQIIGFDAHLSIRNALNTRQYDGAIIDLENGSSYDDISGLGIPIARVVSEMTDPRTVKACAGTGITVAADNRGIGRAAAEFLLCRGFRNFAFLGIDRPWSRLRGESFADTIAQAGHVTEQFELPANNRTSRQLTRLRRWLTRLPKPTTLFVANDPIARQVSNVTLQSGLPMPEDINILSVDNDPIFCESTTPPVSSLRLNTEDCGYAIAKALDQMMNGLTDHVPLTYGCTGVEERMSTRRSDYGDPLVATASRILTDRITQGTDPGITVQSLVRATNASRRQLETRFRAETGRTVHDEITRLRFERARKLLKAHDHSVADVSRLCGFATASHFTKMFRLTFGITPLDYRRQ